MAEPPTGGFNIDFPIMAVALTVVISMVTGAIQLGSVQTHVLINTDRLYQLEARERISVASDSSLLERIGRGQARIETLEKRMDGIDMKLDAILNRIEALKKNGN